MFEQQAMLKYMHLDPETNQDTAKWVGKVLQIDGEDGQKRPIMLHEEKKASQTHFNTNSPGGVDEGVLVWLLKNGIQEFHHWRPSEHLLLITSPRTILALGVWQESYNRTRWYLPYVFWRAVSCPILPYENPRVPEFIVPTRTVESLPDELRYDLHPEPLLVSARAREFAAMSNKQRLAYIKQQGNPAKTVQRKAYPRPNPKTGPKTRQNPPF